MDWECLIVDDGSTDASLSLANSFKDQDPRFSVGSRIGRLKGAAACRNEAVERARGEYVLFLDSDDLLKQDCLSRRVEFFSAHANCDFTVFQTEGFFEIPGDASVLWNIEKSEQDLVRFLQLDPPWSTTGAVWRKSALLKIGGFDETLPGWQDWQLHVTALLHDLSYCRADPLPDSYYRIHGNDKISSSAEAERHIRPMARYTSCLIEAHAPRLRSNHKTRNACVALTWYLAVQLQTHGYLREANRYWKRLHQLNFMATRMWLEGVLGLMLHGRPGGGLAWGLIRHWPPSIAGGIDRSTVLTVRSNCRAKQPQEPAIFARTTTSTHMALE